MDPITLISTFFSLFLFGIYIVFDVNSWGIALLIGIYALGYLVKKIKKIPSSHTRTYEQLIGFALVTAILGEIILSLSMVPSKLAMAFEGHYIAGINFLMSVFFRSMIGLLGLMLLSLFQSIKHNLTYKLVIFYLIVSFSIAQLANIKSGDLRELNERIQNRINTNST